MREGGKGEEEHEKDKTILYLATLPHFVVKVTGDDRLEKAVRLYA